MERVAVIDRKGNKQSFIGSVSYTLKTSWAFGVTIYASGIPVGFFWRPLSVVIGLASPEEIARWRESVDEHQAALIGVKL
jgi:hypothetical protein